MAIPKETNISVVIPCYRSAAFLENTVQEIRFALSPQATGSESVPGASSASAEANNYRIILVNDASPDNTWEVISSLCAEDPRITGVNLEANVGQAGAKQAGISFIRGKYAVFMDDDGQHPADQILPMIGKLEEGWHMVYAQFPEMKEAAWRRFFSLIHNMSVSLFTRKPLRLRITSFFVLDEYAIDILRNSPPASFIGGAILKKTRRVTGFPMDHRMRESGTSTYTFKKLVKHWSVITRGMITPKQAKMPVPVIKEILNEPSGL